MDNYHWRKLVTGAVQPGHPQLRAAQLRIQHQPPLRWWPGQLAIHQHGPARGHQNVRCPGAPSCAAWRCVTVPPTARSALVWAQLRFHVLRVSTECWHALHSPEACITNIGCVLGDKG